MISHLPPPAGGADPVRVILKESSSPERREFDIELVTLHRSRAVREAPRSPEARQLYASEITYGHPGAASAPQVYSLLERPVPKVLRQRRAKDMPSLAKRPRARTPAAVAAAKECVPALPPKTAAKPYDVAAVRAFMERQRHQRRSVEAPPKPAKPAPRLGVASEETAAPTGQAPKPPHRPDAVAFMLEKQRERREQQQQSLRAEQDRKAHIAAQLQQLDAFRRAERVAEAARLRGERERRSLTHHLRKFDEESAARASAASASLFADLRDALAAARVADIANQPTFEDIAPLFSRTVDAVRRCLQFMAARGSDARIGAVQSQLDQLEARFLALQRGGGSPASMSAASFRLHADLRDLAQAAATAVGTLPLSQVGAFDSESLVDSAVRDEADSHRGTTRAAPAPINKTRDSQRDLPAPARKAATSHDLPATVPNDTTAIPISLSKPADAKPWRRARRRRRSKSPQRNHAQDPPVKDERPVIAPPPRVEHIERGVQADSDRSESVSMRERVEAATQMPPQGPLALAENDEDTISRHLSTPASPRLDNFLNSSMFSASGSVTESLASQNARRLESLLARLRNPPQMATAATTTSNAVQRQPRDVTRRRSPEPAQSLPRESPEPVALPPRRPHADDSARVLAILKRRLLARAAASLSSPVRQSTEPSPGTNVATSVGELRENGSLEAATSTWAVNPSAEVALSTTALNSAPVQRPVFDVERVPIPPMPTVPLVEPGRAAELSRQLLDELGLMQELDEGLHEADELDALEREASRNAALESVKMAYHHLHQDISHELRQTHGLQQQLRGDLAALKSSFSGIPPPNSRPRSASPAQASKRAYADDFESFSVATVASATGVSDAASETARDAVADNVLPSVAESISRSSSAISDNVHPHTATDSVASQASDYLEAPEASKTPMTSQPSEAWSNESLSDTESVVGTEPDELSVRRDAVMKRAAERAGREAQRAEQAPLSLAEAFLRLRTRAIKHEARLRLRLARQQIEGQAQYFAATDLRAQARLARLGQALEESILVKYAADRAELDFYRQQREALSATPLQAAAAAVAAAAAASVERVTPPTIVDVVRPRLEAPAANDMDDAVSSELSTVADNVLVQASFASPPRPLVDSIQLGRASPPLAGSSLIVGQQDVAGLESALVELSVVTSDTRLPGIDESIGHAGFAESFAEDEDFSEVPVDASAVGAVDESDDDSLVSAKSPGIFAAAAPPISATASVSSASLVDDASGEAGEEAGEEADEEADEEASQEIPEETLNLVDDEVSEDLYDAQLDELKAESLVSDPEDAAVSEPDEDARWADDRAPTPKADEAAVPASLSMDLRPVESESHLVTDPAAAIGPETGVDLVQESQVELVESQLDLHSEAELDEDPKSLVDDGQELSAGALPGDRDASVERIEPGDSLDEIVTDELDWSASVKGVTLPDEPQAVLPATEPEVEIAVTHESEPVAAFDGSVYPGEPSVYPGEPSVYPGEPSVIVEALEPTVVVDVDIDHAVQQALVTPRALEESPKLFPEEIAHVETLDDEVEAAPTSVDELHETPSQAPAGELQVSLTPTKVPTDTLKTPNTLEPDTALDAQAQVQPAPQTLPELAKLEAASECAATQAEPATPDDETDRAEAELASNIGQLLTRIRGLKSKIQTGDGLDAEPQVTRLDEALVALSETPSVNSAAEAPAPETSILDEARKTATSLKTLVDQAASALDAQSSVETEPAESAESAVKAEKPPETVRSWAEANRGALEGLLAEQIVASHAYDRLPVLRAPADAAPPIRLLVAAANEVLGGLFAPHVAFAAHAEMPHMHVPVVRPPPVLGTAVRRHVTSVILDTWGRYTERHGENLDALLISEVNDDERRDKRERETRTFYAVRREVAQWLWDDLLGELVVELDRLDGRLDVGI